MDQPTVGTGGIVGLDNAADTFAKQYVLSYYHQFNSSTILEAQFGHVDLTHNLNVVYSHLDASSVDNAAGLASSFSCGFKGTSAPCLIPDLGIPAYFSGGKQVAEPSSRTFISGEPI
jgi:hypothetical protein